MRIEPSSNLQPWQHTHTFGQDQKRPGELRTIIVIVITATMMMVEITTGSIFGSMALLADGLHMASHAVALTINAFAYIYARHHAQDIKYKLWHWKSQRSRWIYRCSIASYLCTDDDMGECGTNYLPCRDCIQSSYFCRNPWFNHQWNIGLYLGPPSRSC